MDFIDWRKSSPQKIKVGAESKEEIRRRRRLYESYVEQQIREAMERGEFDNLQGSGKPLRFEDELYAGDKALGYHLLRSNGFAPAEIEIAKEIRTERERLEARLERVIHRGKRLRARRIPPFPSERRSYNASVEKTAREYEQELRSLNRKILTLNLTAPTPMHQPMVQVEKLVQEFRDACPLFAE